MNLFPHFLIGIVYAISIMVFELMIARDVFAQPLSLLDSLNRDVDRAPNDTARIAALCRLSNRLVITEYNDSLGRIKANEAVHLAERLEATTAEPFAPYYRALALQTLGVTYRFANETQRPLAEPLFQAAMGEARRIPDKVRSLVMQASVLHEWFTGIRFWLKLHFKNDKSIADLRSEAEQLLRAEQVIADELNNNALRGQVLLNRATILPYSDVQRLVLAMQSARLYEQAGDYTGLVYTLQYVGFFANYLGDYPFAMQAYKRSVRLQDSMGVQNGLAVCYNAMGDIYARLSDTIKALESYQRAETYSGQFDLKFDRIELLQKIGVLYQRQGLKEKARAYFVRAMTLNKEMNRQINDIIHAGQLYRQQDSLQASLAELTFALRWARKLTVQTPLRQVLYELALTYKQQAEEIKKVKHTARTNRQ
jgi:tetratricopeptide (TPR) repeat protein